MSTITNARLDELDSVIELYSSTIEEMKDYPSFPNWKMGIHPTLDMLRNAISNDELYIIKEDKDIVASMILNHDDTVAYDEAKWSVNTKHNQVLILHLLVVNPRYQQSGYGDYMLQQAISISRRKNMKAIRLDVIKENIPAIKLYEKNGFLFVSDATVQYSPDNKNDFLLYELPLTIES